VYTYIHIYIYIRITCTITWAADRQDSPADARTYLARILPAENRQRPADTGTRTPRRHPSADSRRPCRNRPYGSRPATFSRRLKKQRATSCSVGSYDSACHRRTYIARTGFPPGVRPDSGTGRPYRSPAGTARVCRTPPSGTGRTAAAAAVRRTRTVCSGRPYIPRGTGTRNRPARLCTGCSVRTGSTRICPRRLNTRRFSTPGILFARYVLGSD